MSVLGRVSYLISGASEKRRFDLRGIQTAGGTKKVSSVYPIVLYVFVLVSYLSKNLSRFGFSQAVVIHFGEIL